MSAAPAPPPLPVTPWYEAAFDDLYAVLYSHRDNESARREAQGAMRLLGFAPRMNADADAPASAPARPRVLDACCGAGRHSRALLELGFDAWGFDLSARLLNLARRHADLRGRIVRADLRQLPYISGQFHAVVNFFTSFGYFETDAENERALGELARVLRPGGALLMDHIHCAWLEQNLVPEDEIQRNGFTIHQRRWIERGRIRKEVAATDSRGQTSRWTEDVRLFTPGELAAMFERAGLASVHVFGDFSGEALSPRHPRMIVTAVKEPGR